MAVNAEKNQKHILLLVGETQNNWHQTEIDWDPLKWNLKILGRYWAIFDLDRLIKNDPDLEFGVSENAGNLELVLEAS